MNELPNNSTILALRANVSESDALSEFRSAHFFSLVWRLGNGPLRRIAPAYLPFALYRLNYEMGRVRQTRFVALDQVAGALDLFEFPQAIDSDDLLQIETRARIAPTLTVDCAESLLREKALRLIFQQGFFRLRSPRLEIDCIIKQFYIPYWLGFFGKDGSLRCRALDAVRKQIEGRKVTLLFESWLIS